MAAPQMKCFLFGTGIAMVLAAAASPLLAASENRVIETVAPLPKRADVALPTAGDTGADSAPQPAGASTAPVEPPAATGSHNIAPATGLAPTDQAIADTLRDLAATKFSRFLNAEKERAALDAFYRARDYAPLWVTNGAANGRAQAVIAYLKTVQVDGLDPADYPTPEFKVGAEPGTFAEAELRLTASVLTYARHASIGRVHFSRISADIQYNQVVPEPAQILAKLVSAEDVAAALDSYEPQHAGYKALKARLAVAQ